MKEVFIMVNGQYEEVASDVMIFDTLDELNSQLAIESFGDFDTEDISVYHGVILPAKFLPHEFGGCTPYVFIRNPLGRIDKSASAEGHFEKVKGDPRVVALTIEELLEEKTFNFNNGNCEVTIDDVQLFFGHELQKALCVPQDYVDEELIDRVEKLAKKINEHTKKLEDGTYVT